MYLFMSKLIQMPALWMLVVVLKIPEINLLK